MSTIRLLLFLLLLDWFQLFRVLVHASSCVRARLVHGVQPRRENNPELLNHWLINALKPPLDEAKKVNDYIDRNRLALKVVDSIPQGFFLCACFFCSLIWFLLVRCIVCLCLCVCHGPWQHEKLFYL